MSEEEIKLRAFLEAKMSLVIPEPLIIIDKKIDTIKFSPTMYSYDLIDRISNLKFGGLQYEADYTDPKWFLYRWYNCPYDRDISFMVESEFYACEADILSGFIAKKHQAFCEVIAS